MQAVKKQELAKKAISDACLTCKGMGCRDCASKLGLIDAWSSAGIPVLYWDYSLDTFPGDPAFKAKIEEIIRNVDKFYMGGKSLVFKGRHGIGKTWGAVEILKAAISKQYDCLYTTMNEVIDLLTNKDSKHWFRQDLLNCDYLVIDEFGARNIPTSEIGKDLFGTNLEGIIRSRFQNKLPIIFCTNDSEINGIIDGSFKATFDSLFSGNNLIDIPVGGVDLRCQ